MFFKLPLLDLENMPHQKVEDFPNAMMIYLSPVIKKQ